MNYFSQAVITSSGLSRFQLRNAFYLLITLLFYVPLVQATAIVSVPSFNSALHGSPVSYWVSQGATPNVPTSWRILSIAGPPGLTVTTSGGNVTSVVGGGQTPFEPWLPGINFFTAVSNQDPPGRIDSWSIRTEAVGPGGNSVGSSLLIVSHGPPIVLPFVPLGGGSGGGTWNSRCEPNPLVIVHNIFHPLGVGFINVVPSPGSPPLPPGTTWRQNGPTSGNNSSSTVTTIPGPTPFPAGLAGFNGIPIVAFCGPQHVRKPVSTTHFINVEVRSTNPNRLEQEKCTIICVHDGPFGDVGVVGMFIGLDSAAKWLNEEELELSDQAQLSLISDLLGARDALADGDDKHAKKSLKNFQKEIRNQSKMGNLTDEIADQADSLALQLLEMLALTRDRSKAP